MRFAYAVRDGTSQRGLVVYNGGPNGATGAVPGQPDASASYPVLNGGGN